MKKVVGDTQTDTHTHTHTHRQTDAENLSEYYTLQKFCKVMKHGMVLKGKYYLKG